MPPWCLHFTPMPFCVAISADALQEGYKTVVEHQPVYIHPSSAIFQQQPDWVSVNGVDGGRGRRESLQI